jgi:hypothetical protein
MTSRRLYPLIVFILLGPAARAQFGTGIVFDPTQSAHAAQQILQANQLYTTTVQTMKNVIAAYNLAERMASAPQSLYNSYANMGRAVWTSFTNPANTYGNTVTWTGTINTGANASSANQQVSISRSGQISGYTALDTRSQQGLAAQGATSDLSDSANTTTLQTLGTIRASAAQRETDISALEQATHSLDPTQQTDLATLQRINQALLLELRTQQETNQMLETQSVQQLVGQKQEQDGLKMTFIAADGYEANYNSKTSQESSASVAKALQY